jgi:hypothetical protein
MILSPSIHATYTLHAKRVRDYLVAHPGSTNEQVKEATGHSPTILQSKGLAHWKREDGEVKWYAKDGMSRATKKGFDWRWNPDAMHWEREEETVETKWERYTG